MRISLILLFALVCLIAVTNAQRGRPRPRPRPKPGKCDIKCPKGGPPVCATRDKGKTYRRFGNNCLLTNENCKTKNAWKKADLKKCK